VAAGKIDGPKTFAKGFRHGGHFGALAALEGTQRPRIFQQNFCSIQRVFELIIKDIHAWRAAGCIANFSWVHFTLFVAEV
jgi:hypothetical protein